MALPPAKEGDKTLALCRLSGNHLNVLLLCANRSRDQACVITEIEITTPHALFNKAFCKALL